VIIVAKQIVMHSNKTIQQINKSCSCNLQVGDNVIKTKHRTMINKISSLLFSVLIVFFPKCPACWAAYLTLLGISGSYAIPYTPWLLPVFAAMLLINLGAIYKKAKSNNWFMPFIICCIGVAVVLLSRFVFRNIIFSVIGLCFLIAGTLLNSTSLHLQIKKHAHLEV
jgi:hypothetical protein